MSFSNLVRKTLVSFFGSGYLKPFSGTWGSLASGLVLYSFWPFLGFGIKSLIILTVFVMGTLISDHIEKREGLHDPSFIVIDETVGMMITTLFIGQIWQHWLLAFLLFRFFDIAKIWPASVFDKQTGGFALMFDDVLMAVPALFILQSLIYYRILPL